MSIERMVVRGWASGKCHVTDASPELLVIAHFVNDFEAFNVPVATVCAVVLRSLPIVKMRDAPVDCVQCRRLTGMTGVGPRYGPGGSKVRI